MKTLYRKITAAVLTAAMVLTMPAAGMTARADAVSEADPKDVYVSFGADLKGDEKATVMDLLGIDEEDLEDYTVGEITNDEDRKSVV